VAVILYPNRVITVRSQGGYMLEVKFYVEHVARPKHTLRKGERSGL